MRLIRFWPKRKCPKKATQRNPSIPSHKASLILKLALDWSASTSNDLQSKHLKGRLGPRVSDGHVFGSMEVGWGPVLLTVTFLDQWRSVGAPCWWQSSLGPCVSKVTFLVQRRTPQNCILAQRSSLSQGGKKSLLYFFLIVPASPGKRAKSVRMPREPVLKQRRCQHLVAKQAGLLQAPLLGDLQPERLLPLPQRWQRARVWQRVWPPRRSERLSREVQVFKTRGLELWA